MDNVSHKTMQPLIDAFASIAQFDHSVSIPQLGSVFRKSGNDPLTAAIRAIANIYDVPYAWTSSSGTTPLNVMGLMSLVAPGDKVIIQRDSHVSVYAPIIQLGLRPIYVTPTYAAGLNIPVGITPAQLEKALQAHPDVAVIFLTYPNYFGVAGDLVGCVTVAERFGVPVLVDAAHGAHLKFHPQVPLVAEETNAAIITPSTHKTCSALNQGSQILFNNGDVIDEFYRIVNQLGYVTTSLPHFHTSSSNLSAWRLHNLLMRGRRC